MRESEPSPEQSQCAHPAAYSAMCVSCGARLSAGALAELHHRRALVLGGAGSLSLSRSEARSIEAQRAGELLRSRRLALVLDIDHTLLHAVLASPHRETEADVTLLELEGAHFAVKLRPGLDAFLARMSGLCQLHLYTNGTRAYAETIARLIDPSGALLGSRIVSRSDQPAHNGEKHLSSIFLGDISMVVVVDDREDVWRGEQRKHLLLIKPFTHFSEGADANNAAGAETELSGPDDDALARTADAVARLHAQFFLAADAGAPTTVSALLGEMCGSVLAGCRVHIDGGRHVPGSSLLVDSALCLGAQLVCELRQGEAVTHVASVRRGDAIGAIGAGKAAGEGAPAVWVVHPSWILQSRWLLARADESAFAAGRIEDFSFLPALPAEAAEQQDSEDEAFLLELEQRIDEAAAR